MAMDKSKKAIFGIFAGKKATVSPSSPPPSGNDSSSELPSNGPRSPPVDETVQGHGLVGTASLRLRKETEFKGKSDAEGDAEGESNDESGISPIWRSGPVQRRFSNVSGRQRMIAAEYRAKMDEAFDDLIRNRRLALAHDVASH